MMNRRTLLIGSGTSLGAGVLGAGLLGAGGVAWWMGREDQRPGESGQASPLPPQADPRTLVTNRAEQLLRRADQKSEAAAQAAIQPIVAFFEQAGQGVPAFAEVALGLESKWYLVSDYVREPDYHPQFLAQQFRSQVMSAEGLAAAVEAAVTRFRQEMAQIDNQLLVDLRADLDDLPADLPLAVWDDVELRQRFAVEFQRVQGELAERITGDVGGDVASLVASEVLAAVVIRLLLSGVAIGSGTAAAPFTLGISLLVGLIVDQIVAWLYNWFADPAGTLAEEVRKQLDTIRDQIVTGVDKQPGLQPRLHQLAVRHAHQRRRALHVLIKQGTRT